jgi:hypothetical protein
MGLYKAGFERAGQLFGADLATGFIGLIAISRSGWRETDLRALLPKLSSAPWDELRFAYLRRLFRGQLRQRGSTGRWDFAHTQMRISALSYLASLAVSETALNSLAGEHLLELPREDPLRQTETMVHLIHGLLQMHDLLAVPLKNSDGEVWNAQFISPDGKKRYFKHSRKKGLAFRIGPPRKFAGIVLVEGYSTGASIFEAAQFEWCATRRLRAPKLGYTRGIAIAASGFRIDQ